MAITAYHFTGDKLRDGRPVPAIGEKLVHDGEIIWCESGLYASRLPHQALRYAPGAMLHLVECDKIYHEEGDKFVCRERTIIKTIDVAQLLRRFAADQALSVAHFWNMPDVVREYLTTLDESKRAAARAAAWGAARDAARAAAWGAARDAARAAAWGAARDAARAAAWDAAWDAARDAARDAAWDAAWAAAWDAAWAAAWDAAWDAARDAAWDAARDAARDAAWDAARADFDARVFKAMGDTQ